MSYFNLNHYEPVESRIRAFWAKFPQGRLITDLQRTERSDGRIEWICSSQAYTNSEDTRPQSTGFATEIEGSSYINRANASENCETSSIGRCLANLGFATKGKRPSREEMQKVVSANSANSEFAAGKKTLAGSDWEKLLANLSSCTSPAELNKWCTLAATFSMPDQRREELLKIFTLKKDLLAITLKVEPSENLARADMGKAEITLMSAG